ncbi:MAG: MFS transporter [Deltaproteobacteria bacterium]|nr:MFS transporter [Deltaproteobacteria bacterium]
MAKKAAIPRTVLVLGLASFFTDLSSEMIYPLLPVFLAGVLGAGAVALGVIEGVAESTAAVMKLVSGVWTDRAGRRKPFILAGYGLAGAARPLIGLAWSWPFVLAMRFLDRVGKGLRTSPRDALIADAVPLSIRGRAYGFHRAMDHGGAVAGPVAAAALLSLSGVSMRHVFFLAALPAAVVMVLLWAGIGEPPGPRAPAAREPLFRGRFSALPGRFKGFLLAVLVFTAGNSTDAFILLALSMAGLSASQVALVWSAHHLVKMAASYAGGRLSDVFGRKRMIVAGWVLYAGVYVAFAFTTDLFWLVAVFMAYGLYFGFTEPSEKAWVADQVPQALRGTAFGAYHMVVGLCALPASVLFGVLWHAFGRGAAFGAGAALAGAASVILVFVPEAKAVGADA